MKVQDSVGKIDKCCQCVSSFQCQSNKADLIIAIDKVSVLGHTVGF
jgi:hypothetical protein